MPLDPEVQAYLDRQAASGAPPRSALSIAQTRKFYLSMRALSGTPLELPRVEDRTIHSAPGAQLRVRLYWPDTAGVLPVLLYLHGGRFISGDLDTHDAVCRDLASAAKCLVAAVDYRLAPEHTFPAALEDCYAAAVWLAGASTDLGGDPRRIAVGGDSAGGNLAAATALLARERGGPRFLAQVLVYPMLDATCSLPSHVEYSAGYGPGSEDMRRGYRHYAPPGIDPKDPHLSPLWAEDLKGLPPALVLTAGYDSLRDEGEQYARRLASAGVEVTRKRFQGAIHGFFQMQGVLTLGRRAILEASEYLRNAFAADELDLGGPSLYPQDEEGEIVADEHRIHETHEHVHGKGCGHTAIQHRGHTDYLHDGHLHHPHGDHVDEHALDVTGDNPAGCTPGHACDGHEAAHQHGPDCGHAAIPHGDHTDYIVDGHLHHPHGSHCDNHGPLPKA